MEEIKSSDFRQLSEIDAEWFWQSDPDPFKEKDPSKWQWEPYPYESCCIIENAFSLKKETADLGNYEINFSKMIQVNKKDTYKMRRVKRVEDNTTRSRMAIELPKPSVIQENQKTFSEAFGNVHHFLDYLMKRTVEAYGVFKRLKQLNLDSKRDEFEDIIEEVINSIQQAAEGATIIQARALKRGNPLAQAKMIIATITTKSKDLKSFLQVVLSIYTMESFVCYLLNELLRNEDWKQINVLTPYLVCLTYTFQLQDYVIKQDPSKGMKEAFLGLLNIKKLKLYRGTALTEEHLASYDPKKNKYFSWNSVTSTSRVKEIALDFIKSSLTKAKGECPPKLGAIFIIETAFSELEDCEGMIDIAKDSKYPNEQEVILVPGTVFKIESKTCNRDNLYEIRLKIKKKFKDNQNGISLLGALQKKIISQDQATLDSLTQEEIIKAVKLLAGNKLIKRLMIKNCVIDLHLTELIGNMIMSTNIKTKKLVNNKIFVDSLTSFYYYFSLEDLNSVFFYNDIIFVENSTKNLLQEASPRIKKLSLKENGLKKLLANTQIKELFKMLKSKEELQEIDLAINSLFSDDDLGLFGEVIQNQRSLQKISLDLSSMKGKTRALQNAIKLCEYLEHLSVKLDDSDISELDLDDWRDTLDQLKLIQHLSLDIKFRKHLAQDGFNNLIKSLEKKEKLTKLSLKFTYCKKLAENELNSIIESLEGLKCLTGLCLNLEEPIEVTMLGDSLAKLECLTDLSLSLSAFFSLTDDKLAIQSYSLAKLTNLTALSLDFSGCSDITDNGLIQMSDSVTKLNKLTALFLNFRGCSNLTNNGLIPLSNGLSKLNNLAILSLNFESYYRKISYDHQLLLCGKIDVENLFIHLSGSLTKLQNLTSLSLNFKDCSDITDHGLIQISDSLAKLNLTALSLNFSCYQSPRRATITDIALTRLSESITKLNNLTILSLSLTCCGGIGDDGIIKISDSLAKLNYLTALVLDFQHCGQIKENGRTRVINNIAKQSHLTVLSLDFEYTSNISDNEFPRLCESLLQLNHLTTLCLSLGSRQITDNRLAQLGDTLTKLNYLTALALDFYGSPKITYNGLTRLSGSLAKINNLTALSLDLVYVAKMTSDKIRSFEESISQTHALTFFEAYYYRENGIHIFIPMFKKEFCSLLHDMQFIS